MCDSCKKLGYYNFLCIDCCVRLIETTRPNKQRAEGMLAAISMVKGAPSRSEIIDRLKGEK